MKVYRIQCPVCGHRVIKLNPQDRLKFWVNDIGGRGYCVWYERDPDIEELREVESIVKRAGMIIQHQRIKKEKAMIKEL